jgi:hypothetical protein
MVSQALIIRPVSVGDFVQRRGVFRNSVQSIGSGQ